MDVTAFLLEIFKLIIPALIVFLTAFFVLSSYLENDYKKRLLEMKISEKSHIVPVRLQAYERLTLFVERIQPYTLVLRVHQTGMTARELQTALVQDIRGEFDHNVSQQLFVTNQTWTMIKTVKEETINLINSAATILPPQATGLDLSKLILEHTSKLEKTPHNIALQMIRTEVHQFF